MKREVEPTLSLYNNVVFPALSCKVEVSLTLLRHGALLRLVPRIERGDQALTAPTYQPKDQNPYLFL